jgi:hypothetical protein
MLMGFYQYDVLARNNVVLSLTNSPVDQTATSTALAADTKPTTVSDYMNFTGTQNIRFSDKELWHVTSPYSVSLEVYFEDLTGNSWVATVGEGFGAGWPEWRIAREGNVLSFGSSTTNNGLTSSGVFVNGLNAKQWYRIGFMFLNGRVYGFVNEVQVFDVEAAEPYNAAAGLAIGGDYSKYAQRQFRGRIRNFLLGKSAFWTV